jgi:prevent-host-death family protein
MQDQVAITDARDDLAEVVNRVTYRGDRVVLTRRGKRLVAVVPIADLELLERLENAADLEEIRSALSDPENADQIPWERLKTELGL